MMLDGIRYVCDSEQDLVSEDVKEMSMHRLEQDQLE
jgi:hypothetical protein